MIEKQLCEEEHVAHQDVTVSTLKLNQYSNVENFCSTCANQMSLAVKT